MNKMKKVPEIRFKEFAEDWENTDASIIFKTYFDKNHPDLPVLSASQEYGMIIREDVGFKVQHNKENEAGYKRVLPGQFVIHLRSFQGGFAHSDVEGITSPAYTIIEFRDKSQQDDIFWKYVLTSKEFIKRLETVTYGIRDGRSISFEDFSELGFNVPDIKEQRKIGKTLTVIDTLIRKLEQKLEKLRNIKQSLLNQMFANVNGGGYAPLIRFNGYNNKWIMLTLNDISERITRKNTNNESSLPLTVSAQYGLINQNDFFNSRIASKDVSGYYLIKNGEFAYNKSSSDGYPFGAVKRLDRYKMGVLSTLYIIFALNKEKIDSDFLSIFFETDKWYEHISQRAAEGARNHGLLNISSEDFLDLKILTPESKNEQNLIAGYVSTLDRLVEETSSKLTKLRTMKQSLLQKMFV